MKSVIERIVVTMVAVLTLGPAVAGWEPPRTSRRYVHPPLAERMFVLWNDAKISFAEVIHEKDWKKIPYSEQLGDVCWFFRGANDALFDFRTAKNLQPRDGTPLHGLEWREKGVAVRLETCCDYTRACTLFGRFTVTNGGARAFREEYAVRLRHGREMKLLGDNIYRAPDFYSPFESHPETWKDVPCDWSLTGGGLRSASGGFMSFAPLPPSARWDAEKGELRFAIEVPVGASVSLEFALGYGEPVRPDYAAVAAATAARWHRELAKINRLPAALRDDPSRRCLIGNLVVQILQCFCRPVGRDYVLPRQGCLQRWVWPWDNMEALNALVKVGDYDDYVRGAVDFYFQLYGSGGYAQPEFKGRIGPFGNDWDCNTANVIGILGRYCVDAKDAETWRRYRGNALEGFRWVMSRRVKEGNADGLVPGIFPPGQASDYKAKAQTWTFTDTVNLNSLGDYLEAAEKFGDPSLDEIRRGIDDYVGTMRKLTDAFRRKSAGSDLFEIPVAADGRPVPPGFPKGHHCDLINIGQRYGFIDATDVMRIWRQCVAAGTASPNGLTGNFRDEDLTSCHYWYTTAYDKLWHRIFRKIGRHDLADKILDATLKCAMSREMIVGERYRDDNPWYLPWSPNCSGSGRIIQMLFDAQQAPDNRPETWFHLIGGNVSREGLTADLEAIRAAGYGGIQFFHGQVGKAEAWDGTTEQIPCLSAKWDELVAFIADECARLGLSFKMQNCPGWSMSGGPWIAPSNAMRKLAFSSVRIGGGPVPALPVPEDCRDADSDWRDVVSLAFPTPAGESEGELLPLGSSVAGDVHEFWFAAPVTVRTLELRSPVDLEHDTCYRPETHVKFEALREGGAAQVVRVFDYPQGCWLDWGESLSIACAATTAKRWRLTVSAPHPLDLGRVRFFAAARPDNFEGKAGWTLRGKIAGAVPAQDAAAFVPSGSVREVRVGEILPDGNWTILRVGHVNMKKVNAPAPKEATGWECDKLDPRGIEANFAGYIGRLAKGPLAGGKLKGMVVDSWECGRQTWTERMEEYFREAGVPDLRLKLPMVLGWIVGSQKETDDFLTVWRRTVGDLITRNYYGRMAELAHAAGLSVAYETAFGDVIPGDLLAYWKHCDTPMCEFWQPYAPAGVGSPNFKPVRPCVSAAHLYGKNRIAAEAFTSTRLTWNENFRDLKEQAIRHYARGVTHLVTHTYTHNPQVGFRRPGTSFGTHIGMPFIRGETWWGFMPEFTGWVRDCGRFLERGKPVVDVLRYLGDDADHKPDEIAPFPFGYKCDYLNQDVLLTRLDVRDGRFVLPDGMSYRVIWVPDGTFLLPETNRRLLALEAKGGRIVRGNLGILTEPQIACEREGDILWYHRVEPDRDLYFIAAETNGYRGTVAFRTKFGTVRRSFELGPTETRLLEFDATSVARGADETPSACRQTAAELGPWTLHFPEGWGAPTSLALDRLVAWKDLPGVSREGRAFSGTAVYETTFELKQGETAECLDLGEVRDFARVMVNDVEVAALWAKPYRCHIAQAVKPGRNEVKVEVTSTWFNRLAYDFGQPPSARKTWTVWNISGRPPACLTKDAALAPSGLLGPVRLVIGNR